MENLLPSETLYINNLNEKIDKTTLKKTLHMYRAKHSVITTNLLALGYSVSMVE